MRERVLLNHEIIEIFSIICNEFCFNNVKNGLFKVFFGKISNLIFIEISTLKEKS